MKYILKRIPAHIEDMGRLFFILAIVFICIVLLLFFPVYLETDGHYDVNGRKLAFSVNAYKRIKLFGGYIATYPGGLAVHLSQKKAVLIPYSQVNHERKRFSIFRAFRLKGLVLTTETGAEYLLPFTLTHICIRAYYLMVGGKKDNIEQNLWLTDGDVLRESISLVVHFSIFILLR